MTRLTDAAPHRMDTAGGSISASARTLGGFYARLPVLASFAQLTDPTVYVPLPDGWILGLSDIVRSTAAIEAGRYKAVNTAAAAVIAAVANALGDTEFPFVFGGDGASFALPPECEELARQALAAVAAWVRDDLDMGMRIALVPVAAVRASGLDVQVARFGPSPDVSYAMFSGGGLAWAEQQMKTGAFLVTVADPGTRPDLTGLSCRFSEIGTERGVILSVIVIPRAQSDPAAFRALIGDVLNLIDSGADAGRPVPDRGPAQRWPPAGFALEAKASGSTSGSRLLTWLSLALRTLAAHVIFKAGLRVGGFDPVRYRRQLVENTDFRKFDDGLRLTLDCTAELADRLETLLRTAQVSAVARYGMHRQSAALMTCFVPSPTRSDHVHFVDGATGGYAAAAQALKRGV
jgi:hypothetical protein